MAGVATKVEPRILWKTPGQQPNGLQATHDGLWVIDQIDPNDIYLLRWEDGGELRRFSTRALHSSGITIDPDGHIWVGATFSYEIICFDSETGEKLKAFRRAVRQERLLARRRGSNARSRSRATARTASPGIPRTAISGPLTVIAASSTNSIPTAARSKTRLASAARSRTA